ncbi:dolichol-phosphate mannosyltransferase subunit 3 [Exophiala viscosa]|uniref:Dolichol-phosphate mannosyltransferase subunit 3 n=1 Tax=Exophiala viscosa TaxID=2486360 RepID=A0AAN6DYD9_9EURO|nr:dolichol-phosphate mannosyltransferase subunit 3 [Exophiala viscosa]KAI1624181.1 dolichol-phosphate mannosyltransferase subunit 3 [Exophiala viscosa]
MGRATQTISFALLVSSAYLLLALPLLTQDSPVPSLLPTKIQVEIIPVLPFWALISLGAYLLGRLGLGVLRFNDTKAAYTELMGQIDAAKKSLDTRKVRWD